MELESMDKDIMQLFFKEWAEALEEYSREQAYTCEECRLLHAQTGAISNLRIEEDEAEDECLLVFDLILLCPACLEVKQPELDPKSVLYHLQGGGFRVLEKNG